MFDAIGLNAGCGMAEPRGCSATSRAWREGAFATEPRSVDPRRGESKWMRRMTVPRRRWSLSYAAVRFLVFFTLPRLSCSAATKSMTLLLAGLGGGARRFWPFALASISFWTSSV